MQRHQPLLHLSFLVVLHEYFFFSIVIQKHSFFTYYICFEAKHYQHQSQGLKHKIMDHRWLVLWKTNPRDLAAITCHQAILENCIHLDFKNSFLFDATPSLRYFILLDFFPGLLLMLIGDSFLITSLHSIHFLGSGLFQVSWNVISSTNSVCALNAIALDCSMGNFFLFLLLQSFLKLLDWKRSPDSLLPLYLLD